MRDLWTTLAIATLSAIGVATIGNDEVEWKDWGPNPMANPAFMAEWQRLATPGEEHAHFADSVGEYQVEGWHRMEPDGPEIAMKARADVRTALDGRLMIEDFSSNVMGQAFNGMLIMGYDNLAGEYYSFWFDTMSTWPSESHGQIDADGVMTMDGVMRDILTPKGRPVRTVSTRHDDGSFTLDMYDSLPDGGEFHNMQLNYRKQ